jgi:hypothetical protein
MCASIAIGFSAHDEAAQGLSCAIFIVLAAFAIGIISIRLFSSYGIVHCLFLSVASHSKSLARRLHAITF